MKELHENEQYFFTKEFEDQYVQLIVDYYSNSTICCVCCPMIGKRLVEAGLDVTILDIDERFSSYSQFKCYDITKPKYLDIHFDVIICDPPFFNVSFGKLKKALQMLSHYDMNTAVILTYLLRREDTFIRKFSEFNLHRMNRQPQYQTVDVTDPKRDIRLYTNALIDED